mgnify:CR=1 FL=1
MKSTFFGFIVLAFSSTLLVADYQCGLSQAQMDELHLVLESQFSAFKDSFSSKYPNGNSLLSGKTCKSVM